MKEFDLPGTRPEKPCVSRMIILVALVSVGGRAGAADLPARTLSVATAARPSDSLAEHFPGWLRFGAEERMRLEGTGRIGFRDASDLYLLNRLRLDLQLAPARWLKFTYEAQDSHVSWGNTRPAPTSQQDSMDLRSAFVELGDAESGLLALRVGRQSLAFGEGRLVADPNWSNVGRSFDAVRATIRYGKLRLDAFSATVVRVRDGDFNKPSPGDNFHGLYAAVESLVPDSSFEPYVFWRLSPGVKSELGPAGKLDTKTVGFRWAGRLPSQFEYSVEIGGQAGRMASDRVGAWAGHWALARVFRNRPGKPRLFAEHNHASGDADPRDGRRGTFDQLYPSSHDKFGLADQFMWSNVRHARAGLEWSLHRKLVWTGSYHSIWLASPRDGLYAPGGKLVARAQDGSAGSHVGQELDWHCVWSISKSMQVNPGYARIFPGGFLQRTLPGATLNLLMLNVTRRL